MLTEAPITALCAGGYFPALDFCCLAQQGLLLPLQSCLEQTDEWWLDQSRVCSVPQQPVPPSLALWIFQQYWLQGQISGLGAHVFWGQGLVLADTLFFFCFPRQQVPSCTLELWGE